jgi:hypothetical protein
MGERIFWIANYAMMLGIVVLGGVAITYVMGIVGL